MGVFGSRTSSRIPPISLIENALYYDCDATAEYQEGVLTIGDYDCDATAEYQESVLNIGIDYEVEVA